MKRIAAMVLMTEQEILNQIQEAEQEKNYAKLALRNAKKLLQEADTLLFESTLKLERLREALRVYHNITYRKEHGAREKEIAAFRAKFPDLCEMAKQRDKDRP